MLTIYLSFVLFVCVLVLVGAAFYIVALDVSGAFYTWRAEHAFKRITRTDYTGWTGREP